MDSLWSKSGDDEKDTLLGALQPSVGWRRCCSLLLLTGTASATAAGVGAAAAHGAAAPCMQRRSLQAHCLPVPDLQPALNALCAETGEEDGGGEEGAAEPAASGSARGGASSSRGGLEAKVDALQAELAEIKALLLAGRQQEKQPERGYGRGGLEE